jgi:hypothetical protein
MTKRDSSPDIVINTRDIESTTPYSSLIDIDKNIWVKWGFPVTEHGNFVLTPEKGKEPYVFKTDRLTLKDKEHPEGVEMSNAWVLMMHGYRDHKNEWVFSSGKSVVDTVRAVNQELSNNGEDNLSAILVCNNDYKSSSGIKIHDLATDEGAYSMGSSVHINGFMEEDGTLNVTASSEKFENLDTAALANEIVIMDE